MCIFLRNSHTIHTSALAHLSLLKLNYRLSGTTKNNDLKVLSFTEIQIIFSPVYCVILTLILKYD